jgi:hypothetical protein
MGAPRERSFGGPVVSRSYLAGKQPLSRHALWSAFRDAFGAGQVFVWAKALASRRLWLRLRRRPESDLTPFTTWIGDLAEEHAVESDPANLNKIRG